MWPNLPRSAGGGQWGLVRDLKGVKDFGIISDPKPSEAGRDDLFPSTIGPKPPLCRLAIAKTLNIACLGHSSLQNSLFWSTVSCGSRRVMICQPCNFLRRQSPRRWRLTSFAAASRPFHHASHFAKPVRVFGVI
ncbi:hypothetical protein BKA80DRAFT_95524 [Phyllosticta citrichinensis]